VFGKIQIAGRNDSSLMRALSLVNCQLMGWDSHFSVEIGSDLAAEFLH
jgi:hypothetical protein